MCMYVCERHLHASSCGMYVNYCRTYEKAVSLRVLICVLTCVRMYVNAISTLPSACAYMCAYMCAYADMSANKHGYA